MDGHLGLSCEKEVWGSENITIRALSEGLVKVRLEGMRGGRVHVQPDVGSDDGVHWGGGGGGVGYDGNNESSHPRAGEVQW